MNNNIQIFQLVLLLLLVGAVIFLLYNKGGNNFEGAIGEIDKMRNKIDSVEMNLIHSVDKINESIVVVDSVLIRIEDANTSIGEIRLERDLLVKNVRAALKERREENQLIKEELLQLEQVLIALRDSSNIYQTD